MNRSKNKKKAARLNERTLMMSGCRDSMCMSSVSPVTNCLPQTPHAKRLRSKYSRCTQEKTEETSMKENERRRRRKKEEEEEEEEEEERKNERKKNKQLAQNK